MVARSGQKGRSLALRVRKVTLLVQRCGQDHVIFTTDLPPATPALDNDPLTIEFRCAKGSGAAYLKEQFGWEPDEIIGDDLPPRPKFSKE